MKLRNVSAALIVVVVCSVADYQTAKDSSAEAGLTLAQRMAGQEVVERLYYRYQKGTRLPFEQAVPREVIEKKVRDTLLKTAALEKLWGLKITPELLAGELHRVVRHTQMPERFRELYVALGNDSVLVQEVFIRPALVDRFARQLFRSDRQIHEKPRAVAEQLLADLGAGRKPQTPAARVAARRLSSGEVFACDHDAIAFDPISLTALSRGRQSRSQDYGDLNQALSMPVTKVCAVVDEGEDFLVKIRVSEGLAEAAVEYRVDKQPWDEWWPAASLSLAGVGTLQMARPLDNPPILGCETAGVDNVSDGGLLPADSWSLFTEPEQTQFPTAVWTGTRMLIFGGSDGNVINNGFQYDPLSDDWVEISRQAAPSPRYFHSAVWTGEKMLVWGGREGSGGSPLGTGGMYDPITDTWEAMSTVGSPLPTYYHSAVWTGTEMLVWGASSGSRFDPATNSWSAMSSVGAPHPAYWTTGVWTGSEFIVWGGHYSEGIFVFLSDEGGRYNPVTDSWRPTSLVGAPSERTYHSGLWTGAEFIVWGGTQFPGFDSMGDGARYNPVTDTWSPLSNSGAPERRFFHSAIWTGSRMLIWGGFDNLFVWGSGRSYDPTQDTWTPMSRVAEATPRGGHAASWTGDQMVVWGGFSGGPMVTPAGRYVPDQDVWLPTGPVLAPSMRSAHTAVWTGSEMLIWGGELLQVQGYRYDPLLASWSTMSLAHSPPGRFQHTAVWTGSEMLVWGGQCSTSAPPYYCSINGSYDPITDQWRTISSDGAPAPRRGHAGVWTGSELLVWGGDSGGGTFYGDGALYDYASNVWHPMQTAEAPSARTLAAAAWTGNKLMIWGGSSQSVTFGDGALYDPETNSWSEVSPGGAPEPRYMSSAVWTGREVLVWGGWTPTQHLNSGGRFNPVTNSWVSMQTANAPEPRIRFSATWIGTEMVVWGGHQDTNGPQVIFGDGGRYDPGLDIWEPVTQEGAPAARYLHSAVWTGNDLLVWGGSNQTQSLSTGYAYRAEQSPDNDHDVFTLRAGDCDDNNAAVYPGAPEICDGVRNDCTAPGWPGLSGTVETDDDGDGVSECQADCNDANSALFPGAPQICDGQNNDCSSPGWPALANTNESDEDQDGMSECQGDCNDADPMLYSGAVEINDGQDNQCLGDPGSGAIDEVSGLAGFDDLAHPADFCWTPQSGAISYDVKRSNDPHFSSSCRSFLSAPGACISDTDSPVPGTAFYYLVRAGLNHQGSWGQDSAGAERANVCASPVREFSFVDTPGDDVTDTAVADFMNSMLGSATDYMLFEVTGSGTGAAWCSQRSDFFRDTYLALAPTAGGVTSGSWIRWTRNAAGQWSGITTAGSPNYYGEECFAPWSWCSEYGLNGMHLLVNPAEGSGCEIIDEAAPSYCSPGTWRLTIRTGENRQAVCGF